MTRPANFDRVARIYRWAEYAALGPLLQRARTYFLPMLKDRRQALVLGDGDGRFLAELLRSNTSIRAEAIDSSANMLALLRQRCAFAADRLTTRQMQIEDLTLSADSPDLIATHFVLDCLPQTEVDRLTLNIGEHAPAGALWLVSDFGLPRQPAARTAARMYIRALYAAFRVLTSLRTQQLPDHAAALTRAGFERVARREWSGGFLFTEIWRRC